MLVNLRKGKRAQSLVIVALSATALFGIIALGLDAGRLYFQRRDVQNAADAGALAGAQELLPTGSNTTVTSAMIDSAGCQASVYALLGLLDTPRDGSGTNCSPAPGAYHPNSFGGGISDAAAPQRGWRREGPKRDLVVFPSDSHGRAARVLVQEVRHAPVDGGVAQFGAAAEAG